MYKIIVLAGIRVRNVIYTYSITPNLKKHSTV